MLPAPTAVSAPFLLDPAALPLAAGRVPGGVRGVCVRLVAGCSVGLAARVCGGTSVPLADAEEALQHLRLPESCGAAASLLVPGRSPDHDGDAAGCALVDGELYLLQDVGSRESVPVQGDASPPFHDAAWPASAGHAAGGACNGETWTVQLGAPTEANVPSGGAPASACR